MGTKRSRNMIKKVTTWLTYLLVWAALLAANSSFIFAFGLFLIFFSVLKWGPQLFSGSETETRGLLLLFIGVICLSAANVSNLYWVTFVVCIFIAGRKENEEKEK